MRIVFLTTTDNPYDPISQFDQWNAFDISKGYNTCAYLARIADSSQGLSDEQNAFFIEKAIDEIVELNILGIYKKVVKEE